MNTHVEWIAGDVPDIPKGSRRKFWVTFEEIKSGKRTVGAMWYMNAHVMGLSDQQDTAPNCAVPHNPNEYGEYDEYEWTCWSQGYCDYCEIEFVWESPSVRIIAHTIAPEPFEGEVTHET